MKTRIKLLLAILIPSLIISQKLPKSSKNIAIGHSKTNTNFAYPHKDVNFKEHWKQTSPFTTTEKNNQQFSNKKPTISPNLAKVLPFVQPNGNEKDDIAVLQQQLIYDFAIKMKHIPRVSLLTCRETALSGQQTRKGSIDPIAILRLLFEGENEHQHRIHFNDTTASFVFSEEPRQSIFIKVLQINQLINNRKDQARTKHSGPDDGDQPNASLAEVLLQSEILRQIVVLDLSCGDASRKVIEMVSDCFHKVSIVFFISTYR